MYNKIILYNNLRSYLLVSAPHVAGAACKVTSVVGGAPEEVLPARLLDGDCAYH